MKAIISYSSVKSCFGQESIIGYYRIVALEDVKDVVAFIATLFVEGACFVSCLTHEGSSNGNFCTAGFVELLSFLRHHAHQWLFVRSYLDVLPGSRVLLHADIHTRSGEWLQERLHTYTTQLWSAAEKFRSSQTLQLTNASRKQTIDECMS